LSAASMQGLVAVMPASRSINEVVAELIAVGEER
jgi:hypothetical protein